MKLNKAHVSEISIRPGSKQKMVGLNGEINASDAKDFLNSVLELARKISEGSLATTDEVNAAELLEINEAVMAAYNDRQGDSWSELGAAVSAEILESVNREGFMRRLLKRGNAPIGTDVKVRIHDKGMVAVQTAGLGAVEPIFYKNKFARPKEFTVAQHVLVPELEIVTDSGNLLEDAVTDGRESVMVTEDLTWKRLADAAVATGVNPIQTYVGGITYAAMAATKAMIEGQGIPVGAVLSAVDGIQDFTAAAFTGAIGPIAQTELVMTGRIGTVLGMEIQTDIMRHRSLRVLNPGEFYFVGFPDFHGVYTDRYGLQAKEQDGFTVQRIPSRGWYIWEILSMIVYNAASVAKGVRA